MRNLFMASTVAALCATSAVSYAAQPVRQTQQSADVSLRITTPETETPRKGESSPLDKILNQCIKGGLLPGETLSECIASMDSGIP